MPRAARDHFRSVLVAATITILATVGAYLFTPSFTAAVGDKDRIVFHDFHEREMIGAMIFRWTNGASTLSLPQVGRPQSAVVRLGLWIPETQPPIQVTLAPSGDALLNLPVHGPRTIAVLLPRKALGRGDLALNLQSSTWSPPQDPRPLGVAVTQITWAPIEIATPPLRQIWALPALAVAVALLLSRLRFAPLVAAGVGTISGVLLALLGALLPLGVAPYSHRLLLMVGLAHATLLMWSRLASREAAGWRLPERLDARSLIVLLGIGYWALLGYQWALCLETGAAICPRPGTHWIGTIALVLGAGLALAPRLSPDRRRDLALLLLGFSGVAEAVYSAGFAFRRSGPDFFILWRAAFDFHLGRPLYKLADVLGNHYGHVFKVPPFYGMLFLPFATANDNYVLIGHRVLNVVLYLVTGGLLACLLTRPLGRVYGLAAVTVVMGLMQPPFDTIAYGQIDIVLLLLLTLALLGLRDERAWLVGLAIALAGLFKLYPIVLTGFLLVRREWKALAWTAIWLAALNGIAIGVMGWANHVIYVTQVLPNIGGGTSWVENQTINGFLSRLITGTMRTEPIEDPLINLLTYGAFALVAGISLLLAMAPTQRRSSAYALQFSNFAVVMVLAVPAAWMHYSTITILPMLALLWHTAAQPITIRRASLLALAFGLIAYGNQWSFFIGTRNPGLPELALSFKGYGLAILWGLVSTTILRAWVHTAAEAGHQREPERRQAHGYEPAAGVS